jgi:N utilization substance protein A
MKFLITDVKEAEKRKPQIYLSRTHPDLVRKLFELEVPEIREGIVSINSIAREAGSRTKMAVSSMDESVDPVGACVGNRGNRVQAVVDELNDEKIDIIPWSEDKETNIKNALAPAGVEKIVFDEEENRSTAVVPDFQLSLAIGKEGQNVRLAARLCGVKIDIKSHSQYYGATEELLDVPDAALDEDGFYNVDDFLAVEEEAAEEAAEAAEEVTEASEEAAEAAEEALEESAAEAAVETEAEVVEEAVEETTEDKTEDVKEADA